jgi:cellulose synthase/poly-beta-1,6-N-acetylglucosamine synthase-like glycosyltransferase
MIFSENNEYLTLFNKVKFLTNKAYSKVIMEKTWAIIPAYNEEKTIKEVVLRTKKFINNILVVNDGSTDKTPDIIENIGGISIINVPVNLGKANALKSGMQYLKKLMQKGQSQLMQICSICPKRFLISLKATLIWF